VVTGVGGAQLVLGQLVPSEHELQPFDIFLWYQLRAFGAIIRGQLLVD